MKGTVIWHLAREINSWNSSGSFNFDDRRKWCSSYLVFISSLYDLYGWRRKRIHSNSRLKSLTQNSQTFNLCKPYSTRLHSLAVKCSAFLVDTHFNYIFFVVFSNGTPFFCILPLILDCSSILSIPWRMKCAENAYLS